jgi:hypothetical protein
VRRIVRTIVDVDEHALDAAHIELDTKNPGATVNAAPRAVRRRRALADFDVVRDIDGTSIQVEANRRER